MFMLDRFSNVPHSRRTTITPLKPVPLTVSIERRGQRMEFVLLFSFYFIFRSPFYNRIHASQRHIATCMATRTGQAYLKDK